MPNASSLGSSRAAQPRGCVQHELLRILNIPPKPQKSKNSDEGYKVNGKIRAREVFVIGEEGAQLGVMTPDEAMQIAQDAGLDLVEVNPNAKPPVCKILDYGKFLYEQKKQSKGSGVRQDVKEIRLRPKTGAHDLEVKVARGRKFLEKGHKVQLTMLLRGREKAHPERAEKVLLEVAEQLTDMSKVEQTPKLNMKCMSMLFAPDKNSIQLILAARKKAEVTEAPATADGAAPSDAKAARSRAKPEVDEDDQDDDEDDDDDDDAEEAGCVAPRI